MHLRRAFLMPSLLVLALSCWAALGSGDLHAQETTLRGFVTDASSGQALEHANVALFRQDRLVRGAVTNRDGVYLIPQIDSGRYRLVVSFVGYQVYRDTLSLAPADARTLNVTLQPQDRTLGEILIESERTGGAARITAGRQTIRPADIERIPTPDVSSDLAGYLTVLPGVVTTGDQGGQLFIRGGEPAQNLVLIDGMTLYQPFHVVGFYSAFPADLLSRVDLYAGGFPSRYGERISSVIDVVSRSGNNRRLAGAVGVSPFLASLRLEGPLALDRISVLASVRESMVQPWAEYAAGRDLPFRFGDAFAKVHAEATPSSRISLSAVATHDGGTVREDPRSGASEEVRWWNRAVSGRYFLLPGNFPIAGSIRLAVSSLRVEQGLRDIPERFSEVRDLELELKGTLYGDRADTEAGMVFRGHAVSNELGGLFQNISTVEKRAAPFALYFEPEVRAAPGLRVRIGLRLQLFDLRPSPFFEPRLRVVWERGRHQVSAAAGLYHQEIVGLVDRRDAAGVFTVWSNVPRRTERIVYRGFTDTRAGKEQRAWHAIAGYHTSFAGRFDFAVEGFYKRLANLFIAEWTPIPHLTTNLQPAAGRSAGFDLRLEFRRGRFYGLLGYGYSATVYEARQRSLPVWFGTDKLRFRPAHDRRHQISVLTNLELHGFDLSVRWQFGSGLPFSRVLAFDGFVLIDQVEDVSKLPAPRRVVYERPFRGVLPTYHRLDASIERTFALSRATLTVQAAVINAYDRRNIFYLDVFTLRRADQLPFVPSLGIEIGFD